MAKLIILFVVVFVAVQITLAGRIVRDTENTASETASNAASDASKQVTDFLSSLGETFKNAFTEENLNKISGQFQDIGKRAETLFNDLATNVKDKVQTSSTTTN